MPKPMATSADSQMEIKAIHRMRRARTRQLLRTDREMLTSSNALRTRMSAWWDTIVFKLTKEVSLP